ncbi:hypothetical protein BGZ65_008918, partial [Modicella reniformis]
PQSNLILRVGIDSIVFSECQKDGHKGSRVIFPNCSKTVARNKARRHYIRIHGRETIQIMKMKMILRKKKMML